MTSPNRPKIFLLFLGDAAALYAALFLTLAFRYGRDFYQQFLDGHFIPFSLIFIVWLLMFYVSGLYDLRRLRNNLDFFKTLALSLVTNAILASLLFYLIPAFGIAPKTNLFLFLALFAVIEVTWRRFFNLITSTSAAPNRILLVGNGASAAEIEAALQENPQMGYEIVARLSEEAAAQSPATLAEFLHAHNANLIVVPRELKRKAALTPILYALLGRGILITDLDRFYELVLRKIPLADVQETWFLENVEGAARFYDPLKHAAEFVAALAGGVLLLPLELLIALLVKLTSRGPVIYKQTRVGQNGRLFTLYKFRTMRVAAQNSWLAEDQKRITRLGRFLRAAHLDELPQLFNVLRGEVSLVGPRPDFIDFYNKLKDVIPYYSIRTIVKPGITGWAQVSFPVTESIEETRERLCYDLYYLKNRSLILDLWILLKTIKNVFTAAGK